MTVRIPNNLEHSVTFDYGSEEFTISVPRWNPRAETYSVNITWADQGIYGIFIAGGVDMLTNFPHCPLPNLWAYNESDYIEDIDQETIKTLALVIRS